MTHYLLLRLQRANKLIILYPGRLPWAIILLGLRPATARNIGCCTITMVISILRFRPASAHNHNYYPIRRTIVLLELRPAIARHIGCCAITLNSSPLYYGELAHNKDGLKAQKVYNPEQRSGYKLTNYLALWKSKRNGKNVPLNLLLCIVIFIDNSTKMLAIFTSNMHHGRKYAKNGELL